MIGTALLLGLLVGRWSVVPFCVALWTVVLLANPDCALDCHLGGGALAAINAAIGVLVHIAVRAVARRRGWAD